MDLWKNEISRIERKAFSDLKQLKTLKLIYNELTEIRGGTFDGLPAMEYLWLSSNKIETIENDALNLPSLTLLNLDSNRLKRISDVVFNRLPKLSMLSLEQNELEHIGRSLYRLKKIDNINLYDNRIQDIDLNEFSKLPLLRKLEMGRSGFTFATTKIEVREIYNNTELHYLYISNNDLSDARELSKLRIFPFLKFLDLSNNLYENLDVGSNQTLKDILPRLESLDFTDTSIECRNMVAVSREFGSAEIEHLCYF